MLALSSVTVRNFRLYEEATVDFAPGLNLLYGENAQGKTSLLEAIYCMISGRSFRTSQSRELIRHGADSFFIDVHFTKEGVAQRLRMGCDGKTRRMIYNSTPCLSVGELIGILHGVVIAPDDPLIMGAPQQRRLFLDLMIAQTDPLYTHFLSRYNRALRQRNQLLRLRDLSTIGTWEQEMAKSALYLMKQRDHLVSELRGEIEEVYPALSGEKSPLNIYISKHWTEQELLEKWKENRERELKLGYTTCGPHRDDLKIFIGDHPAQSYGSEGQKRTAVASLRLAGWKRLYKDIGTPPLLLIDDIGISLDTGRRKRLLNQLQEMGQVFVTSTENPSEHVAHTHLHTKSLQSKFFLVEAAIITAGDVEREVLPDHSVDRESKAPA